MPAAAVMSVNCGRLCAVAFSWTSRMQQYMILVIRNQEPVAKNQPKRYSINLYPLLWKLETGNWKLPIMRLVFIFVCSLLILFQISPCRRKFGLWFNRARFSGATIRDIFASDFNIIKPDLGTADNETRLSTLRA